VEKIGYGIAGGYCADVKIHSSMNYYQEHALPMATEPHWLHKDVKAIRGTVILCFSRVSNLYEILICGPDFCHCFCELEKDVHDACFPLPETRFPSMMHYASTS
jgi:hypothetical protein